MKIVIYINAGCFSQTLVYLSWCVFKNPEDKIYYYYYDKYSTDQAVISRLNKDENLIYNFIEKNGLIDDEFEHADLKTSGWPRLYEKLPHLFTTDVERCGGLSQNVNIFKDPKFPEIRKLYNTAVKENLILKKSFLDKIWASNQDFHLAKKQNKRIFCIMLRTPIHYRQNDFNLNKTIDILRNALTEYDYILPITQVHYFYETIVDTFGDKVLKTDRKRMGVCEDWFFRFKEGESVYEEVEKAFEDVYLASCCDYILGSSSNMFLAALFFNLNCNYGIQEELSTLNGC